MRGIPTFFAPAFPWWTERFRTNRGGKTLPEGFEYRSDNNPDLLTGAAIHELLTDARVL